MKVLLLTAAAFLLGIGIAFPWLKRLFYSMFRSFFAKHAYVDAFVEEKLARYAICLAACIPGTLMITMGWIRVVKNGGTLFGIPMFLPIGILTILGQLALHCLLLSLIYFFNQCYQKNEDSKQRPIKGIVVFIFILCGILLIATIASVITLERPIVLLSSMGATAALFIFAFQHMITSMVIAIQIRNVQLFKIGDEIEIKDLGIEGVVEMIAAHFIKLRGYDNTIISFPNQVLMQHPLINYQQLYELNARQVLFSLIIDQRSIRFLSPEEIQRLPSIDNEDGTLLDEQSKQHDIEPASPTTQWTNLELFIHYAEQYLLRREDIRQDMDCYVHCLQPTAHGLPVETYCFTSQSDFQSFVKTRSSILIHFLAIMPSFHLDIYQAHGDLQP